MILQSIDLADQIEVRSLDIDTIRVHCRHPQVPTDKSNLAYRAAELMVREFPDAFSNYGGVEITIKKQIPVAAGLAGGSTNAAAVLVGIDLLWNLGLTKSELEELGATLGSDVPFCISGGTAIATGRGEKLSPLPNLNPIYLVLAKYRSLEVSTPWAYKTYRQQFGSSYIRGTESLATRASAVHSGSIVKAILDQDAAEIAQKLHNDLERVVLPAYPQVLQLRELFAAQPGVLGTMMSGSGTFSFCHSGNPITSSSCSSANPSSYSRSGFRIICHPNNYIWNPKFTNSYLNMNQPNNTPSTDSTGQVPPTPLRCLTGAAISGGLGFAMYSLMIAIATTFATKPIHSDNP